MVNFFNCCKDQFLSLNLIKAFVANNVTKTVIGKMIAELIIYDAMKKPDIKKKFETMIKSKEGFMKTQAFAMKMLK